MRALAVVLASIPLALLGTTPSASAQDAALSVSGLPAAFATPTGAAFAAGATVYAITTTYTVTGNGWATHERHTETITVECVAPCPSSGPKGLATLQWRRVGQATWNTLTTSPVQVEPGIVLDAGTGKPPRNPTYGNSIEWRFLLSWTADPPGSPTSFNVRLTLTQAP